VRKETAGPSETRGLCYRLLRCRCPLSTARGVSVIGGKQKRLCQAAVSQYASLLPCRQPVEPHLTACGSCEAVSRGVTCTPAVAWSLRSAPGPPVCTLPHAGAPNASADPRRALPASAAVQGRHRWCQHVQVHRVSTTAERVLLGPRPAATPGALAAARRHARHRQLHTIQDRGLKAGGRPLGFFSM